MTVFYITWVIFDPVKLLVVFIAIADSWLNFRQRWAQKAGTAVRKSGEHERDNTDDDSRDI